MSTGELSHCTLYFAGHSVHWVQGLGSANRPRQPQQGRIIEVARGVITVQVGSVERAYRNHQTRRLRAAIRRDGADAVVDEGWSILRVGDRRYGFSIADASKPWQRCRYDEPRVFDLDSMIDRILSHGGVTIPASLLTDSSELPPGGQRGDSSPDPE